MPSIGLGGFVWVTLPHHNDVQLGNELQCYVNTPTRKGKDHKGSSFGVRIGLYASTRGTRCSPPTLVGSSLPFLDLSSFQISTASKGKGVFGHSRWLSSPGLAASDITAHKCQQPHERWLRS